MRAVIYGVKSSPDEKESVADQHRLIREAIDREGGREVIGEPFGEANASGYRRERGPQLEAAMRAAIEAVAQDPDEGAELWVWHSSRLARGDGTKGKRSIQLIVAQLLYEGVTVRSVADPEMVTPMLVGIASTVSNKYSEDLSAHTKRGLAKRKAAGKPVGPVPYGYKPEPATGPDGQELIDANGKPMTTGRRIIDTAARPRVVWIFERTAAGATPGEIARKLNADGVRTTRGQAWRPRTIRDIIDNDVYEGERGYERIVDADLVARAREKREEARLDPAHVQRRNRGGRPAGSTAYLLRRLLFCGCGAPMYASTATDGSRSYVCKEVRQCTGVCFRPRIPAQLIESQVTRHLHLFVGKDLDVWIAERLAEQSGEHATLQRTLDARRYELADLDRKREKRMAELTEIEITPIGLEVIARIDAERDALTGIITDIEARLGEWSTGPSSDAILDFYCEIRDAITGRVANASGPSEVAAVLHDVFASITAELSPPDANRERTLRASFVLRRPIETPIWYPAGEPIGFDDPLAVIQGIERDVLPKLPQSDAGGSCTSSRAARRSPRRRALPP